MSLDKFDELLEIPNINLKLIAIVSNNKYFSVLEKHKTTYTSWTGSSVGGIYHQIKIQQKKSLPLET